MVFGSTERADRPGRRRDPGGRPRPDPADGGAAQGAGARLIWVNGPAARFNQVPGFYAIAGTRPAWQLLPEAERQSNELGLDALPLDSTGARGPQFRAALLELRTERGPVAGGCRAGGDRAAAGCSTCAAAAAGGGRRPGTTGWRCCWCASRRIVARQDLAFRVDRVGTPTAIATVAQVPAVALWSGLHPARRPRRLARQRPVPEGLMPSETERRRTAAAATQARPGLPGGGGRQPGARVALQYAACAPARAAAGWRCCG